MNRDTDPLLALLRKRYGEHWDIRRTQHLWIATAVDPEADHAPTVIEEDSDAFMRQLDNPPERIGDASPLSSLWIEGRLVQLRDGVYLATRVR
ncbi:hypothetical protein FHX37_2612 [Haloactinospora alba]|uniref:Uncharacterized protein n=1 Tax=Haloactinospora alba TaxID=405555 RepID=A0A543NLA9_9ACTN|nr:hypothetical protein FHX37_2612 [Haloactinospora alba]